jgi:hypothetical protein
MATCALSGRGDARWRRRVNVWQVEDRSTNPAQVQQWGLWNAHARQRWRWRRRDQCVWRSGHLGPELVRGRHVDARAGRGCAAREQQLKHVLSARHARARRSVLFNFSRCPRVCVFLRCELPQ